MKILGIYGSPRKGGNTDQLLDKALQGSKEAGASTSTIYVRKLKINGCIECGGCDETGKCVVKDDMQDVYPMMEEADAIILSSPIFFYGLTAQLKALVDRTQAMWAKRLLNKSPEDLKTFESGRGYLIAAGATKGKNLFDAVHLIAKYYYDALDMSYEGGLFYRKIEKKKDILEHPELLKEAYDLGKNIAGGLDNPA